MNNIIDKCSRTLLCLLLTSLIGLNTTVSSQQLTSGGQSIGGLAQAQQQASAYWNARMTRCGQDFFTKDRNYIHQFRNVEIRVSQANITRADRLNGLQWRGQTSFTVGQSRTFSPARTLYQDGGWSKWSEGFTNAMGGIGLMAELRQEKGRWSVIPNSASQAGKLSAVSCSEAANPAASYKQAQREAFSAEVRNYKDNAAQMGIYAHNLPDELWTALYRCGNAGPNTRYTTVSHVYLAPNGGWATCGRNGCMNANVIKVPQGHWLELVTKTSGYLLLERGQDQNGQDRRNFLSSGLPPAALDQLVAYVNQGATIDRVRIGYNDEWFVMARGIQQCFGCPGGYAWHWGNVSNEAEKAFRYVSELYNSSYALSRQTIKDVAFLPNGGFVIIFNKNTIYTDRVPEEALAVLSKLHAANREINQVTFGPNDSWLIRANGWW